MFRLKRYESGSNYLTAPKMPKSFISLVLTWLLPTGQPAWWCVRHVLNATCGHEATTTVTTTKWLTSQCSKFWLGDMKQHQLSVTPEQTAKLSDNHIIWLKAPLSHTVLISADLKKKKKKKIVVAFNGKRFTSLFLLFCKKSKNIRDILQDSTFYVGHLCNKPVPVCQVPILLSVGG